jgi:hypothetical protein
MTAPTGRCPNGTRLTRDHIPSDDGTTCLACGLKIHASPTPPADGPTAPGPERTPECEACGLISSTAEFIYVRTINGGLRLCRQCLDVVNGKNPELPALRKRLAAAELALAASREEAARLAAERDRLRELLKDVDSEYRDDGWLSGVLLKRVRAAALLPAP